MASQAVIFTVQKYGEIIETSQTKDVTPAVLLRGAIGKMHRSQDIAVKVMESGVKAPAVTVIGKVVEQ